MQTLKPRDAAANAVARPMPRLPPVMITTLSVKACSPKSGYASLEQPHQHRDQCKHRNKPYQTARERNLDEVKRHVENPRPHPHSRAERAETAVLPRYHQRQRQRGEDRKGFEEIAKGAVGAADEHTFHNPGFVARTGLVDAAELCGR